MKVTKKTTEAVMEQEHHYYLPVFNRYPIVISHGEGPYVYDNEGKKYIDFLAGIAVNVLGHGHPSLVNAICEQAHKVIHCSNLYYTAVQAELVYQLAKVSGLDKIFLANSGAEANEGALKLARKYGKTISADKFEIIAADHSFHGRTLATLTATGQPKYQKGYEPLPEGFLHVPYNDLAALEARMSEKTCAVFLETIQGEGGIHVPLDGYFSGVRKLCDKYHALLVLDEIQCGMGRTGRMFAYQLFDVKPDIATVAKGLAGGVPIGAFMATDKIAKVFAAGDHGSTFGGNPLASAAGVAVLKAIVDEKLLDNVVAVGQYLFNKLLALKVKYPKIITGVRGKGLMLGAQLTQPGNSIVGDCLKRGVIINCTAGDVLRFVPPLNITTAHVDEVIAVLDEVLAQQSAE